MRRQPRDTALDGSGDLPVRLVVADAEEAYLLLVRVQVSALPGVELVGEAKDGAEAVELAVDRHADAVLLGCLMSGMAGVEAARTIHETLPGVRVYLHTSELTAANADGAEALGLTLLDKLRLDETLLLIAERRGSELPDWEPVIEEKSAALTGEHALPGPDSRRLERGDDGNGSEGKRRTGRSGAVTSPRSLRGH